MYKIKIDYTTGNSFGSKRTCDYLDLTWENLEIAKENLKAIEDHYKYYSRIENNYTSQLTNQAIYTEMYNKFWWFAGRRDKWFVKLRDTNSKLDWCIVDRNKRNIAKYKNHENELRWDSMSHYRMKLKADNGNLMQQSNFWCGYFESLHGAEIEKVDSDLKFEI